ncbi:hypothetical protein LDENG_00204150 [Lucifuga dentata]|nr:hypothetical protein LDENG_00204150 [Lucifuga dentata]
MGSAQSSNKLYCNQYLNGQGPPPLTQQADEGLNGTYGAQPLGQMTWVILHRDLPGFPGVNTLQVNFAFSDGIQMKKHPHPGQPYAGMRIWAYLPENHEGRKVLKLLDKAFRQQVLFTVSTNQHGEDVITSVIPLKTQTEGGTKTDSYPDADYLKMLCCSLIGQTVNFPS